MIVAFRNSGTEDIFNGINSKAARQLCPQQLWRVAARKLDMLDKVATIDELLDPPGNHLEPLSGDRAGQYSIRIDRQYRIFFIWTANGHTDIEIIDYH